MSPAAAEVQLKSFVLMPLGMRKVAVAADSVIELVAPGRVQKFPHRTPWLSGVIMRRGRVIPICDIGRLLGEEASPPGSFHLIAESQAGAMRDWYAIPVRGECVLAAGETTLPTQDHFEHITGTLSVGEEQFEILDLGKLIQQQEKEFTAASPEPNS
jgi:hypothetical protein